MTFYEVIGLVCGLITAGIIFYAVDRINKQNYSDEKN